MYGLIKHSKYLISSILREDKLPVSCQVLSAHLVGNRACVCLCLDSHSVTGEGGEMLMLISVYPRASLGLAKAHFFYHTISQKWTWVGGKQRGSESLSKFRKLQVNPPTLTRLPSVGPGFNQKICFFEDYSLFSSNNTKTALGYHYSHKSILVLLENNYIGQFA